MANHNEMIDLLNLHRNASTPAIKQHVEDAMQLCFMSIIRDEPAIIREVVSAYQKNGTHNTIAAIKVAKQLLKGTLTEARDFVYLHTNHKAHVQQLIADADDSIDNSDHCVADLRDPLPTTAHR